MSLCVHVCVCHSNTLGSISTKTVRGVVACCGICEKLVSSIKFFIQTKYSLQRRKGGMGVGHWDFVSSTRLSYLLGVLPSKLSAQQKN